MSFTITLDWYPDPAGFAEPIRPTVNRCIAAATLDVETYSAK
jgi:hypothetical protein